MYPMWSVMFRQFEHGRPVPSSRHAHLAQNLLGNSTSSVISTSFPSITRLLQNAVCKRRSGPFETTLASTNTNWRALLHKYGFYSCLLFLIGGFVRKHEWWVDKDLEGPLSRYLLFGHAPGRLEKTTKHFNQGSRQCGQDLNRLVTSRQFTITGFLDFVHRLVF
jgi:hypothetical protein